MNSTKNKSLVILFALISLFCINKSKAQNNDNFETAKNIEIFIDTYRALNSNYVDELQPGDMIGDAISKMLSGLDPYTIYIPESQIETIKMMSTGEYGGIGALIHKRKDTVIISEPYEGSPAAIAGLKAGDKILKIGEKSAIGLTSDEISSFLKGESGTVLPITILRINEEKPLTIDVTREIIKIKNIPWFGMVNENIGYIKLDHFTQNAGQEVKEAFVDLKNNNNLKGIVLDLRGNGGGLLNEAVNIVNIFYEKGQEVVSTKGRISEKNFTYRTRLAPVDTEIPVAVLVDGGSASASEIVAGALQDIDRAIIIGQRTFGKGLVQNVLPLSYNSQLKVTIAKYYTPSGRCIQAIDYSHKDESGNWTTFPDSLSSTFETKGGRIVKEGAGIEPDITITPEEFHNITFSLYTKNIPFDFATIYSSTRDSIAPPEIFEIDDQTWEEFKAFAETRDYSYTTQTEVLLQQMKKSAKTDKNDSTFFETISQLETQLEKNKSGDIDRFSDEIKALLKMELTTRYYFQKGRIRAILKNDKELKKAIYFLENPEAYNKLLNAEEK